MPSASDSTATAVNIGFRRSCRSPKRRSLIIAPIVVILQTTALVTNLCKGIVFCPRLKFSPANLGRGSIARHDAVTFVTACALPTGENARRGKTCGMLGIWLTKGGTLVSTTQPLGVRIEMLWLPVNIHATDRTNADSTRNAKPSEIIAVYSLTFLCGCGRCPSPARP